MICYLKRIGYEGENADIKFAGVVEEGSFDVFLDDPLVLIALA